MNRTPGPLTIVGPSRGGTPCDDGGDYAIMQNGGVIAETIHRINETRYENARANAEFIVHAWNTYDELLDAAQNAANVLAALATGQLETITPDSPAIAQLRTAITNAKKGIEQ